jgi:hypothetical protein
MIQSATITAEYRETPLYSSSFSADRRRTYRQNGAFTTVPDPFLPSRKGTL